MKIGIVGSSRLDESERFRARMQIALIINGLEKHDEVITGDAEGVDELVRSFASDVNCMTVVKALSHSWSGHHGFKERNIKIGQMSDFIYSIATKQIHDRRCYHCDEQNHDRTGGCWTKRNAMDRLGKAGKTIVI